ncbi:hypothetical protein Tcan_06446 [Toxocara canis]|uniref:Uncharacterized protein n=1 Tax=Toxocara canis TaxID=6265 RepID=A0A0B2VPN9_TOXCA|nr:hypothetical protein Tcan_06446 [Toxocara canis]
MLIASALIFLQVASFSAHSLRCFEGVNCAMQCDQCEGAACIRILRGGHYNSVKPALALTCLPYDAHNYDGAPEGCRTRSADGSRICFCYSNDFCNRSSYRSSAAFALCCFFLLILYIA